MKKVFLMMVMFTVVLVCNAQNVMCETFKTDYDAWEAMMKKYKPRGNKAWAMKLTERFPLNADGCIEAKYVVNLPREINISDMEDYLTNWINLEIKNGTPIVDKVNHILNISAQLLTIGRHMSLASYTSIDSEIDIRVEIKENRVRLTVLIPRYTLTSGSLGGHEAHLIRIGDCYPWKKDGDHKNSYAMAYINAQATALEKVKSFMTFMEKHQNKIEAGVDDNW